MNRCKLCLSVTALGLATIIGSFAIAQVATEKKPAAQQPAAQPAGQPQLPPGWTESDMAACMAAMTPGEQHKHLAKSAGTWAGKNTMWMYAGAEPMKSESTMVITPIMDGRYVRVEASGEMPGMGPFQGFGINGFDNVSQKFVTTWIDSCGTGIMTGTGTLSPDGKVMTWTSTYNCPIKKGPVTMREIDTVTGPDTFRIEMHMADPKSGKEFKMMQIDCTRTGPAPHAAR